MSFCQNWVDLGGWAQNKTARYVYLRFLYTTDMVEFGFCVYNERYLHMLRGRSVFSASPVQNLMAILITTA